MKKFTNLFITILLLVLSITSINANPVDSILAKVIAKNLYYERVNVRYKVDYSAINLQLAYTRQAGSTNVYYVFNITGKSKGFVIISADDAAYPVLGYSLESNYVMENQSPAFIDWMDNYRNQIMYIKQNNLESTEQTVSAWQKYQDISKIDLRKNILDVAPLLTTTWAQMPYYNEFCPVFSGNDTSVTGCPATAMGQIMNFWKYPPTGTDINSYTDAASPGSTSPPCQATASWGTISADFSSGNYDWLNMPASLNSGSTQTEINAVAQLLFHCGVSVNTNYSPCGSSISTIATVANAFKTYFGYSTTAQYVEKSNYSNSAWAQLLMNELNAGRPIQYAGTSTNGGHTFVCDGYQGTDLFHFNWGWSGSNDGYYFLNNGGLFNSLILFPNNQTAVIGIQPGSLLELNSAITANPNPLQQNQSAVVSVTLSNIGQTNFNGSLWAVLTDAQNQVICHIDSGTTTLNAGSSYNINFNASSITAAPGNYKLKIYYRPAGLFGGWWILAAEGNYTNPIDIQVVSGTSTTTLQLFSATTISPNPMVQNQNADIVAHVENYGSSDFTGNFSCDLYSSTGQYIQNIDNGSGTLLAGNSYNLTFHATPITVVAGNYYIAVEDQPTGYSWEFTDQGSYSNPIIVQITSPPDQYESNNTEATAYSLPVTFNNDNAVVQTTNSNLHITSDIDYYKINLPIGYNYTISSRVQDSYDSNNGQYYTCDVQYAYKTSSGWSGAIDTQASDFVIYNGGTVYFEVVPYSSGDLGTYLLDLSISRACILPDIPVTPTGTTLLCQNPANTVYTTTSTANTSTYTWSISPSGAGTITGTGTSGTVDWNNTYTGTANIAVMGNNSCGIGGFSNSLTVTVNTCTGISENSNNNFINIYPNPANDNLTVEAPQNSVIEISNIQGQLIKSLVISDNKIVVDISAFPNGMYYVKVKAENGIVVKKFIKE